MSTTVIKKAKESIVIRPLTSVYVAGVLTAMGVSSRVVTLTVGLLLLTFITLMVVLNSLVREVKVVHVLVNSQRDVLLSRISDLVDALNAAGITLPKREQDEAEREEL